MAASFVKDDQRLVGWLMDSVGLKALLVGQVLSFLLASSGWLFSMLVRSGINAPLTQAFLMYFFFTLVYGPMLMYKRKAIHISWYWYLLLAVVDVQANYLALVSYQFTSITSVMLLNCWTIPCVLFLSWQFLLTRYSTNHFLGVAICVTGMVVVVFSDVHSEDRASSGTNALLGDSLVVAAAVLFASLNVSEEFVVKKVDQVEYLALIGFFGMIVSGFQLVVLESEEFAAIDWNVDAVASFMAFALASLAFSSLMPWLLRVKGSTMFNLSLLTSNMWAVAVQALGFHKPVDGLYFVALGLVGAGLLLYSSAGEPSHSPAPELKYTLIAPVDRVSTV